MIDDMVLTCEDCGQKFLSSSERDPNPVTIPTVGPFNLMMRTYDDNGVGLELECFDTLNSYGYSTHFACITIRNINMD
jgi:hypothetical protein